MADHPSLPKHNPNATVGSVSELLSLNSNTTHITIDNGVNDPSYTALVVSRFSNLKRLVVGNHCFSYASSVDLIGLSELESVEIGENSFTQHKNRYGNDPNGHFYVKNCPKLKSLKMGRYSFSDYTVCEVENVDALEVIEMGDLNEESRNFDYASLELKSVLIHNK